MKLNAFLSSLAQEFSGLRAKDAVAHIAGYHRIQASPGFDEALDYVASQLAAQSVETSVHAFVADGLTETYGWISPPGWTIRSGSLEQITPQAARLGSYDEVKISILGQSAAGDAEGEVVHVGAGDSEACFEGLDLAGKFVLSSGRPAAMLKFLKGRGASGLIIYPDVERAAPSYDLVQYGGFFPHADEIPWLPMGFSISRRTAEELLKALRKGAVRVRGRVDAEFIDHPMQVLEATIGGSDPSAGEVLLCAHLCHPAQSANDNASGSGVLIEVARVLATLAKRGELANTVRMIWVPEFNGTVPWVAARAESLSDVLVSINLDMVGQSPDILGEPLRVFRVPNVHPVFLNALFEPLLKRIAEDPRFLAVQGSRRVLHWVLDAPTGGSDHLVFQAPPADIPSTMFGHDDPFWHTDQDTLEKVDPTRLKCVGVLTALLAALPSWGPEEAEALAEWLLAYSHRALTEARALAREAVPVQQELLDTALSIETARASSLACFLGDRWNSEGHLEALRETARALGHTHSGPPKADGSEDVPQRVVDGPVCSARLDKLSREERAFFEEKLSFNHGAAPQVLALLADGTRTLSEIAACLSLDFGRIVPVSDVARAVELMSRTGTLKAAI